MNYAWSESASRYAPAPTVNRRHLTNTGYLLSLGVSEVEVTGLEDSSGVSWDARYKLLCSTSTPPAPIPVSNSKRLYSVKSGMI